MRALVESDQTGFERKLGGRAVMASKSKPSAGVEECIGGLAEQDDVEFEPYRAGISAEAVDAAYRLLAPSAKVGPHANKPAMPSSTFCITVPTVVTLLTIPTLLTISRRRNFTSHLLHHPTLLIMRRWAHMTSCVSC